MKTERLLHIKGNTWVIDTAPTIPVYFLNEKQVVLLDSGFADRTRPVIDSILSGGGLSVRAVIGTHSHIDHSGNHVYLQKTQGAEIILRDLEAAAASDYGMLSDSYVQSTRDELMRDMPYMILQADRTFTARERSVFVDGAAFGIVPLPGHTAGHTGIVTSDDVFYVGDALSGKETLERSKLPTARDWNRDLQSKLLIRDSSHAKYVLAHEGVYDDIVPVADENLRDRSRRLLRILGWLTEREVWTLEEIQRMLWERLDIRTTRNIRRKIFIRNVRCVILCLEEDGWLEPEFDRGVINYRPVCRVVPDMKEYAPNPDK